ncbi:centrosomal protein of 295 kDa isoform X3 [Kryptolebias marmoratus]|uniref:centrosomal protein of 295 kDa isoform X3 n=1 Tax=Kryptolebias marmoratus TaxID=37003 RepID=UPI0018ACADF6|nr:centrosomal protein of 295 kDa isoform X3 [Kryptolebias marmoratus]
MKRKVSKLRLSPNEEARIIREEHERRRKLRIQQVRDQQRYIALQIRREVEQRRQCELRQLEQELREDWERQQRDKLQTLQRLYQESLQLLGQGHRSAKENEPDLAAVAQREEENQAKAEERYREALKELKTQKIRDHERQNQPINARKKALQAERERSAKVASLPPPPPNPIQNIDVKKPRVVKRCDPSAFATTHYHMLKSTVEREAETAQPDAHREAELEARRLQQLQKEEKRRREEQLEKARVRGRQALRREQLVQDRERLLVELEHLQQTDLLRRRQQVSQMPPQIFQPLYKRQETREDFQREMEFAFEDMYTGERRVKGDLVVQLIPEPLPASSTGSRDQELDVTLDETSTSEAEHVQNDTEQEAGSTEQEPSAEATVEPSRPAPRRALRKLLDRIRSQRNEWVDSSSRVCDSPTVTDQIPERDSTIESGSLQSEEKHKQTFIGIHEPTIPPPAAVELRNQPDSSLPDVLVSKIQEFEEERKKREEELETEKRQQLFLLQELEEQKAKLEQMLLEAQQEREHLKAAVTQETTLNQPEEPVRDQEVTPGLTTESAPPAGEDDHTRRIREYQQRLLEQNRVHQRSVEVARQRLEEYQQALQIRHNMTTRSMLPVVRPPSIIPLHSTQSDHLPAPPQLPTTPAVPPFIQDEAQISEEVVRRHSEALASPPRPAFSVSSGSKLLSGVSDTLRLQRPNVNAYLTDNIMKRVTEHLPERLRPSSVSEEQLPHGLLSTHESTGSQSSSDPLRAVSPGFPPLDPGLVSGEEDMERQRRELLEAQRRVMEQREAVMQQQRLQEDERRRKEVEMEQMRRQKETLQALIDTDEQPVSHPPPEELESEDVGQQRLRLLVSLLKAIEESNGGTLSHLEDPEESDDSLQQTPSDFPETAPAGPPQPSGLFHPPRAPKPPVTRVKLGFKEIMTEQHELSAIQEVETPVNMSHVTGQEDNVTDSSHTADQDSESFVSSDGTLQTLSVSSSGQQTAERRVGSETSVHLPWRERLLSGAGTSPEHSDSDSVLKVFSPLSSDSGRGADFSGPANTSYKSPTERLCRPPESVCFSSTTISSGSYVTTDPEQNADTDKSLSFKQENGADLSDVSSPCGPTLSTEENSSAGRPAASVHSVFDDSSIQRIIDKYTRELNVSLGSAETATGRMMEDENSAARQSFLSHTAGAQRSVPDLNSTVHPNLEHFSTDQDSFQPLIGHLTDQSSCLAADQRESVLEQLVGQPSAHSSMIGPLPSFDQGGWDSTLSRMIGRLSHQSGSLWLSPGQDFYAGQLMGRVASESSWLDGSPEESQMRPLIGELDESADQHSGSSGESSSVVLGVVPSDRTSPPEAPPSSVPVPDVTPHLQDPSSTVDLDSQGAEEGSDLFHPLEAEITHNETADPSMTFHLPEHNVSDTPEGYSASGEHFEPSPEQLRTEEQKRCRSSPSLQESFSQLLISECPPQESILIMSPSLKTDVEQNSYLLSNLSMCCDTAAQRTGVSEMHKDLDPVLEHCAGEKFDQEENQMDFFPSSEKIIEAAGEKGILEQSEITLVSLTDTTLQDEETTITEEMVQEDDLSEGLKKDDQTETEELQSTSFPKETPEEDCQTHSGTTLEFQWGPSKDLQDVFQQKRSALLQRSNRRVEELKAKGAQSRGTEPVTCKAKTTSQPQKNCSRAKGGQAAQKRPPLPSSVSGSNMKKVEVKICTPEQRKHDLSVMHKRTQRLYEQLEEVKQQKTIRSRQEDYARNRLKAKEFHKKTLQKLRAKQTPQ